MKLHIHVVLWPVRFSNPTSLVAFWRCVNFPPPNAGDVNKTESHNCHNFDRQKYNKCAVSTSVLKSRSIIYFIDGIFESQCWE